MNALVKSMAGLVFSAGLALTVGAALPIVATEAAPTVTLDAPGWSLAKICEAISSQIGTKVEAHGDCVTDHLIVKVKSVPWSVLQQKLAWAEYGRWQSINNVLTLERDPKLVQARIQQNIGEQAARISNDFQKDKAGSRPFDAKQFVRSFSALEKQIEESRKTSNDPNKDLTSVQSDAFSQMSSSFPFATQLTTILSAVSPQALASVPIGARVVFSNHPTSLQQAMPAAAQQAIQSAIEQNNQLVKAFIAAAIEFGENQDLNSLAYVDPNSTINVSVRNTFYGYLQVTLRAYNPSGTMVMQYPLTLAIPAFFTQLPDPNKPITQFKLPPDVVQVIDQVTSPGVYPPTAELLQTLRHPLQTDPLALELLPAAETVAQGKNIVVSNDWLIGIGQTLYYQKDSSTIPSDYFTAYPMPSSTDANINDQWLALRTNYATRSPIQTVSRTVYDNLIQTIAPDGLFDFVPSMRYTTSLGPTGFLLTSEVSNFLSAIGYGKDPIHVDPNWWNLFRLTGSLDDGQLIQAESERGLNLNNLAPDSREILKEILLSKFMDPAYFRFMTGYGNNPPKATLYNEPTYAFAQSLPEAVLTIKLYKSAQISFPQKPSRADKETQVTCDATTLATYIEMAKSDPNGMYGFDQMKLFPAVSYAITISFPGTNLPPFSATFTTRAYNPKIYKGLDALPAELRDETKNYIKKYFEPPAGSSSGG